MFTETSAFDRSLPCTPPPETDCAMSEPSLRLVAPASTSVPPLQSPKGLIRVDVKTIAPENGEEVFPKELLMTAYVKDDTYTIVLVNNSTSKAFETKLEIEGKEFQTMISYTSDEGVKWQRKKVNPSLSGLRAITVPKFSVVGTQI